MKNSTKEKKQNSRLGKKNIVLILTIIIAVIIAVVIFILTGGKNSETLTDDNLITGNHMVYTESGETVTGIAEHSGEDIKMSANISVPGYDTFYFKSGTKEQDIELDNPEENTCYFVMTLSLEDGTEIWKSDLLEPGVMYDHIALEQELKAGTYENVKLNYDCYALNDMHTLNGAEIEVSLEVE